MSDAFMGALSPVQTVDLFVTRDTTPFRAKAKLLATWEDSRVTQERNVKECTAAWPQYSGGLTLRQTATVSGTLGHWTLLERLNEIKMRDFSVHEIYTI